MNKRLWITAVFIPFLFAWGVDRLSKVWASDLMGFHFFGPVGFTQHHNHGALLGLFSELPSLLRVVSLSTGGAFLIFAFFILQYLLPTKSLRLRAGMSLLMGGIIGNVTDRILYGYVIDYVFFRWGNSLSPVFNFADAIQWVGYGMIVFALIREGKLLWPDVELRKSYWINFRYQIRYCLLLVAFGFSFFVIAGTFSYSYFKVTIIELVGKNPAVIDRFLWPFMITMLAVTLGFMAILFLVGLILSHRAAGPIYAFERFLEDMFAGNRRNLRLRAGDDFRHLEELADKLVANKKLLELIEQSNTIHADEKTDSITELPEGYQRATGS